MTAKHRVLSHTTKADTDEDDLQLNSLPDKVDYIHHPSFESIHAEEEICGGNGHTENNLDASPSGNGSKGKSGRLVLTRNEERRLFLRYNYARYRMNRCLKRLRKKPTRRSARELSQWIQLAELVRSALVKANMGLVSVMAKRSRIHSADYDDLVSEGSMALLRSIDKFDVSRGYKFSTYACRSILKSFYRLASKTRKYRERFPTEQNAILERMDRDSNNGNHRYQEELKDLREILTRNLAELTAVEQVVIRERFALTGENTKRTLSEVAEMIGLTDERVRQIQKGGLSKLRAVLRPADRRKSRSQWTRPA